METEGPIQGNVTLTNNNVDDQESLGGNNLGA